jgi:FkbM family methyltransferase
MIDVYRRLKLYRLEYLAKFGKLIARSDGLTGKLSATALLFAFLRMKLGWLKQHSPFRISVSGVSLIVDVMRYDQSIIFEILIDGRYDQFDEQLPADPVIFDCGANIGVFTLDFWRKFPQGRVFAFEPSPPTFRRLEANLALNGCDPKRIVPFNCAVSDSIGECRILNCDVPANSRVLTAREATTSGGDQSLVPTDTLDHIVTTQKVTRIDLLKIDTEGHELPVLRGAAASALQIARHVVLEIHAGPDYDAVERIMTSAGFSRQDRDGALVFYERVAPYRTAAV